MSEPSPLPVASVAPLPLLMRDRLRRVARAAVTGVATGVVAAILPMANIVSFGALMFHGPFAAGMPVAVWSMLVAACVGGTIVALTTSLSPLATGIDSPTGAFLVLLSAATAPAAVAHGASNASAVNAVMLTFTAATAVSAAVMLALGLLRWGSYFRFVPYFVVAGFLVATGGFLIAGGVHMAGGVRPTFAGWQGVLTPMAVARLGFAAAVLLVLLALRRWLKSPLAAPVTFMVMWLAGVIALHLAGLGDHASGWYLPSLGALVPWRPWATDGMAYLTWPTVADLLPEFLAVTAVALISLVTKVSSLEVSRQVSANLDREFWSHGVANLAVAPAGGIMCSLQIGTSRLLEQAGTRTSAVVCSLVLGAVALAHLDLPGMVPVPIVAGLLFYLGYTFIGDAITRPLAQRAWLDLLLAAAIALVCLRYGYLVGVLAGLVGACVHFAVNYARLGVIRRTATGASFPSNVDRSAAATSHLREAGESIRIYWLSGYIFFGSSEGVFERIRDDIQAAGRRVTHVVLDFAAVPGADSSAVASLTKLRNFCDRHGVTLAYSALPSRMSAAMHRARFFGGTTRHKAFDSLEVALAWCEDRLLARVDVEQDVGLTGFTRWLADQLGSEQHGLALFAYLDRKDTAGAEVLYREGEPANSIDLVAAGTLNVEVVDRNGRPLRVRRVTTHSLLGEMGFMRRSLRTATVASEGPATIFTLHRESFERMRAEFPELASAFDAFVVRVLADRMDAATRAAVARP